MSGSRGALEKHVTTGLAALCLAGILWVAKSVAALQVAQARTEEKIMGLTSTTNALHVQVRVVDDRVRRLEQGDR